VACRTRGFRATIGNRSLGYGGLKICVESGLGRGAELPSLPLSAGRREPRVCFHGTGLATLSSVMWGCAAIRIGGVVVAPVAVADLKCVLRPSFYSSFPSPWGPYVVSTGAGRRILPPPGAVFSETRRNPPGPHRSFFPGRPWLCLTPLVFGTSPRPDHRVLSLIAPRSLLPAARGRPGTGWVGPVSQCRLPASDVCHSGTASCPANQGRAAANAAATKTQSACLASHTAQVQSRGGAPPDCATDCAATSLPSGVGIAFGGPRRPRTQPTRHVRCLPCDYVAGSNAAHSAALPPNNSLLNGLRFCSPHMGQASPAMSTNSL